MMTAGFPAVPCEATVDDRTGSVTAYNRTEIRTNCTPWAFPQARHGNPFCYRCIVREGIGTGPWARGGLHAPAA
jgi:hypothetical protein